MEISKKEFLELPSVPGVYTFWKGETPIYIGKSINLKSRLNSYLDLNLGPKTRQMVSESERVSYIEVTSDLESLLLEADLVHKHKPKYNILLKDDKHALYIIITREEFPRVLAVRKLDAIAELNLNLYSLISSYGPFPNSTNVKMILKLIRKLFPYSDHKIGKKPCLYSHLGLCNPCPNVINNKLQITSYKKNVRNIKLVLSRKFNVVRKSLEVDMKNLSKEQKYEEAALVRERIKALDYITQEKTDVSRFIENPTLIDDIRSQELEELKKLLSKNNVLLSTINRIECFDIAHLAGNFATASMVVLIDGQNENSEYRHFKVRQKNSQSDYDSMREIVARRIKNFDRWQKPDLVIVDGGLGQVKAFHETCKIFDIPVVGIAKHPDRLIFPDGTKIRLQGPTLHLVSRIRDEAHRFARRLHHKLIKNSLLT